MVEIPEKEVRKELDESDDEKATALKLMLEGLAKKYEKKDKNRHILYFSVIVHPPIHKYTPNVHKNETRPSFM